MRRRVAAAVLAVAAAGAAAGCDPRPQSSLAVRSTGESLEAVVYVCEHDAVARLSVTDPDNGDTWAVAPSGRPHLVAASQVVVIPMVTAPPSGWDLVENSLAGLDFGRRYELKAGMLRSRPRLHFRPDDVQRAGSRLVVGDEPQPTLAYDDEFHHEAARACLE